LNKQMQKEKIEIEKNQQQLKKELQKIQEEKDKNNAAFISGFSYEKPGFFIWI